MEILFVLPQKYQEITWYSNITCDVLKIIYILKFTYNIIISCVL